MFSYSCAVRINGRAGELDVKPAAGGDRGNPRSDSASADAPFAGNFSSRPKRRRQIWSSTERETPPGEPAASIARGKPGEPVTALQSAKMLPICLVFRNCLPVCSNKSRRLARRMVRFVARQGQTPITSVESARWSQAGTNRDRGNPRSDSASADAPFAGTSSSRPIR